MDTANRAETRPAGRPRSEAARRAVLEAVDDMLVEQGYAAMTMKGIAERAGVGRQTVYRWWSSTAEVLVEACVADAAHELRTPAEPEPAADLECYLVALGGFLTEEPPGLAYRALLGEAQHDPDVATLVREADVLGVPTLAVLDRVRPRAAGVPDDALAVPQLLGPVLLHVLATGSPMAADAVRHHVRTLLVGWAAR